MNDKPIKTISAAEAAAFILYPHGIAIHNGIDRVLITSTVKPDMSEAGDTVTVLEAKTGKVLSTHKVSSKPSPAKAAPVEVMFAPNSNPPVVHITNMLEATLWAGVWDPKTKAFPFHQVDDFGAKRTGDAVGNALQREGGPLVSSPRPSRGSSICMTIPIRVSRSFSKPFPPRPVPIIACCRRMSGTCSFRIACSIWKA